jgi:hypothetical protein
MDITVSVPDDQAVFITAAREDYNKNFTAQVALPPAPDADPDAAPVMIDNPAIIASNEAYLQFVLNQALASWQGAYSHRFRIPTGTWLQRWTTEEKKAVRTQLAPNNAQMQAWLDSLDENEFVNLTHPDVAQGVPAVCAALEQIGVIAAGTSAARAAVIMAQG